METRITNDNLFMQIAFLVAKKTTCLKHSVGAVLVKDGHQIASGFNGAVAGFKHCEACYREKSKSGSNLGQCVAVHAEENAIIQCAVFGVSSVGAIIYCTDFPCSGCLRAIINARIKKIVYCREYPNEMRDVLAPLIEIERLAQNTMTGDYELDVLR